MENEDFKIYRVVKHCYCWEEKEQFVIGYYSTKKEANRVCRLLNKQFKSLKDLYKKCIHCTKGHKMFLIDKHMLNIDGCDKFNCPDGFHWCLNDLSTQSKYFVENFKVEEYDIINKDSNERIEKELNKFIEENVYYE